VRWSGFTHHGVISVACARIHLVSTANELC
jgi:hypothetical protein